jgi:hypothetical protein
MKNKDWLLNKIIESGIRIKELKIELQKSDNDYYEMKCQNEQLQITIKSLQRELEGKHLMDIKL